MPGRRVGTFIEKEGGEGHLKNKEYRIKNKNKKNGKNNFI